MTRDEIGDGLLRLVEQFSNDVGDRGDDPVKIAERAYVAGLAAGAVLQLRDRLFGLPHGASLIELSTRDHT